MGRAWRLLAAQASTCESFLHEIIFPPICKSFLLNVFCYTVCNTICDPYVLYLIPCGPHVIPSCNPFPPTPARPILLNASISLTLVAGSPALLPCSVRLPDPALSFQWFHNAQLLDTATTEGIQLLSNGSLTIANVRTSLGGTYICVASNSLGTVRSTVAVNVEGK